MKYFFYLLVLISTSSANLCFSENRDFKTVEGGALYLRRGPLSFETHRAEFDYPADCEFVAKILRKEEPLANWYCSTSVPDIKLKCQIKDFEIVLPESEKTKWNSPKEFGFKLVLNREVAHGELKLNYQPPFDFDYKENDSGYLLTNNYKYVSGNYFTSAFYILSIRKNDLTFEALNIGGQKNGTGNCIKEK